LIDWAPAIACIPPMRRLERGLYLVCHRIDDQRHYVDQLRTNLGIVQVEPRGGEPGQAATRVKVGIETDRGRWVAALIAASYEVFAINPLSTARYGTCCDYAALQRNPRRPAGVRRPLKWIPVLTKAFLILDKSGLWLYPSRCGSRHRRCDYGTCSASY
jgi:hypothetical protein